MLEQFIVGKNGFRIDDFYWFLEGKKKLSMGHHDSGRGLRRNQSQ